MLNIALRIAAFLWWPPTTANMYYQNTICVRVTYGQTFVTVLNNWSMKQAETKDGQPIKIHERALISIIDPFQATYPLHLSITLFPLSTATITTKVLYHGQPFCVTVSPHPPGSPQGSTTCRFSLVHIVSINHLIYTQHLYFT